MDFEFRRMDFNDILSLTNYGIEVLEEVKISSRNDRNLIDVNMKNDELKRLIKGIPLCIEDEIDKKVDDNTPITIGMLEKILNSKFVNNKFTPRIIKNKIIKPVEEMKEENEQPINSIDLYNTIMNNIDNIAMELENNYNEAEAVVETLNISKEDIRKLIEKLDLVINAGIEDLELYKNSDIEDPLKSKKIELATKQLTSLRKNKDTLTISIQQKDVVILNIGMYIIEMRDWMLTSYPTLSNGVESTIEVKYISNRTDELKDLNEKSVKVFTKSAETLKLTTEKNVKMLENGSLDTATINKYLKTVQEALKPVKGYIENKENATKKLISELDHIEKEIDNNNVILSLIQSESTMSSIEEPKQLKLEMKNSNNV